MNPRSRHAATRWGWFHLALRGEHTSTRWSGPTMECPLKARVDGSVGSGNLLRQSDSVWMILRQGSTEGKGRQNRVVGQFGKRFVSGHAFQSCHHVRKGVPPLAAAAVAGPSPPTLAASLKRSPDTDRFSPPAHQIILWQRRRRGRRPGVAGHARLLCPCRELRVCAASA
jgi:hypothetical protein